MLYKVILTFESVDKILKCDHSNESYRAVLSCGAVQDGSTFESVNKILKCDNSTKATKQYYSVVLVVHLYTW